MHQGQIKKYLSSPTYLNFLFSSKKFLNASLTIYMLSKFKIRGELFAPAASPPVRLVPTLLDRINFSPNSPQFSHKWWFCDLSRKNNKISTHVHGLVQFLLHLDKSIYSSWEIKNKNKKFLPTWLFGEKKGRSTIFFIWPMTMTITLIIRS
jgi:hypothetical protein